MDKYGVDEVDKKTPAGDQHPAKCPKCGRALDADSNVFICPECGTLPFEPTPGVDPRIPCVK